MTKIENLSSELAKQLIEFSDEIRDTLFKQIDRAAEEGKKVVQSKLSNGNGVGRSGKYKKSIKAKKEYEGKYNKKDLIYSESPEYRLTHLLENGHLTRDGKKRTKAVEHWKSGQETIDKIMGELG